jgi:gliding motility-associated-like protein
MALPGNGTIGSPKGDVEMKDSLLSASSGEMITAVGTCDSIWVIAHRKNSYTFVKTLVTSAGIVSVATQNVNTATTWNTGFQGALGRGSLAFNLQGTKLAMTGEWPIGTFVFDFSKTTGNISNAVEVKNPNGSTYNGYGTEWSPDGLKLYVSTIGTGDPDTKGIFQYNTSNSTSTWVVSSSADGYAEIVKGKDDKLYIGRPDGVSAYLAIINNPNAATGGAAGFVKNGINVGNHVSFAMPQAFDCSMIPVSCQNINLSNPSAICSGASLNLSTLVQAGTPAGTWTIQSGTGGTIAGSTFSSTGGGTFALRYTATNPASACSPFADVNLTVNATPNTSLILAKDQACAGDATFALSGGAPSGGTYSGTGVNTGNFDPSTAGTFTITYSVTQNGCSASATDNITVNAVPNTSLTLAKDQACAGDAAFVLSGGAPSGGTYSGTGVNAGNFNPSTGGTITITYSVTQNGCSASATDNITVNAVPNTSLTLAKDQACAGDAAFALSGGTPSGGTYSGTGVSAGNFNPSTAGTFTITYAVTQNGCSASATDNIIIDALPQVTLNLSTNKACSDTNTITLEGGLPLGGTYTGTGVNNGVMDIANLNVGNYTITYTLTQNGCTANASDVFTIHATPTVSLGDTNVCPGGNITLIPFPNNFIAYQWSTNESTSSISYNTPNSTVWVKVTDANGCKDTAFAFVKMGDTLHVDFGADKEICANESISLNANEYGPFIGTTTYTWNHNLSGSIVNVNEAGEYIVEVMDGRGCIGNDTVNVNVHDLPKVDLGNDTTLCFSGKEVLAKEVANIYSTILWSNGKTTRNVVITQATTLSVTVSNSYGCYASSSINVEEKCEPTIICFPNVITPNNDGANDEFIAMQCDKQGEINDGNYRNFVDNIKSSQFEVFDRWGLKMFQSLNLFPRWDGTYNGEPVAAGVYYFTYRYTDSSQKSYEHVGWIEVIK